MISRFQHLFGTIMVLVLAAAITACGGSSSSGNNNETPDDGNQEPPASETQTLSGTAATGAPIDGFIYLTDANGQPGTAVAYDIDAEGNYEIDVSDFLAPFILKAVPDDGSDSEYSYADAPGIANITPMTTLALFEATGREDLETLFDEWSTRAANINTQDIIDAAQALVQNFNDSLQEQGVNPDDFDIFSSPFAANNQGFDAVLDSIVVSISGGTVTINGQEFTLPDTAPGQPGGPDVPSGDWDLTITGSVKVMGTETAIPETTFEGIPVADQSHVDQAFSGVAAQGLSCSAANINLQTDTASLRVFTVSTGCTINQNGFELDYEYDLTYTYTR